MKIELDAFCCGKCLYFNGDMSDKQAFCDEREDYVSKDFYRYRYEEDEAKEQKEC